MKKRVSISTIVLTAILVAGICVMLYPTVSDYWNSFHQSRAVANYESTVASMDREGVQAMWDSAVAYNERLAQAGNDWDLSDEELAEYNAELDVSGTGVMGYIQIPKINVQLPIYHGTDDAELQIAIGHLEGSSLPVGGAGTHVVLTGHRGLPSARLFTDLDQLEEGDVFVLNTLGETLTYQVDQIRIVEPYQLDELTVEEGQDLCTLVTCTPYGINTHRLLVRGHRVANITDTLVTGDALLIDSGTVAAIASIAVLVVTLGVVLYETNRRRAIVSEKGIRESLHEQARKEASNHED